MLKQRGDTIIEVLLAITIFSVVAVGGMAVMNQGSNAAQRALEVTLVKEQINSQAEALRAARQMNAGGDSTTWSWIKQRATTDPTTTVDAHGNCNDAGFSGSGESFVLNGQTASYLEGARPITIKSENDPTAPPYAQMMYRPTVPATVSYGIWIDANQVSDQSSAGVEAYDFTIHACWYSPGQSQPMQLQTIVRLYDA